MKKLLPLLMLAACGTPQSIDAGTDAGTVAEVDAGCAATRESAAFLGNWNVSGTVTKNGATWAASFPIAALSAPNCKDIVTVNGECSFTWTPVGGGAQPAVDAGANSRCSPGARAIFTFNGMQTYNGSVDPFPGVGVEVVFTSATMVANADGGILINGSGTLGTRSGSEAMSFSYTGKR